METLKLNNFKANVFHHELFVSASSNVPTWIRFPFIFVTTVPGLNALIGVEVVTNPIDWPTKIPSVDSTRNCWVPTPISSSNFVLA
jgi:hypothetical protein